MPTHKTEYLLTARDKTGRAFKSAESSMKKVGVAAAAAAAAGTALAASAVALVKSQADATRSTRVYAESLGLSVEQMSRYEHAFASVGIESEKTGDILKDVAEKIGDAYRNNAGEAKEALDSLGLSIRQINQLSPDQQLLAIADALDQVGTQGERVQIMEALANDASRLLPLLEDNAAGLRELAREADETNRTLTRTEAAAIEVADRALKKLDGQLIGLKQTLAVELSGPMSSFIEWLTESIPVAVNTASEWLDSLTAGYHTLRRLIAGEDTDGKSLGDVLTEEVDKLTRARDAALNPPGRTSLDEENAAHAQWLALKAEQRNQELELEWRHQQQVRSIIGTEEAEILKMRFKGWRAQSKIVATNLEQMTRGISTHSRTAFEINKIAALSNALLNIPEAASNAYTWGSRIGGPPFGAAMASLAVAAQVAQADAIKSQEFGGGGGSAPSFAGSAGLGQPVQTAAPPAPAIPQDTGPAITVIIEGSAIGDDQVRDVIVQGIQEAIDNDELDL